MMNRKRGIVRAANAGEDVLAFFPVVASKTNLSTSIRDKNTNCF
jgi:hypothetical protein